MVSCFLPMLFVSGLLDSNQRPRAPQTCALPTALNPDPFSTCTQPLSPNAGAKVRSFFELTKFSAYFLLFSHLFFHFSYFSYSVAGRSLYQL